MPVGTLKTWEVLQKKGHDESKVDSNLTFVPDLRITVPKEERKQIAKRANEEPISQIAADYHVTPQRVGQIVQQEKAREAQAQAR